MPIAGNSLIDGTTLLDGVLSCWSPPPATLSIQVEPGPGEEVSKGKRTISQRETLPIEPFVKTLID